MKSIEDFLKRQPLTRYSDYARPVARMMSGETNILTPTVDNPLNHVLLLYNIFFR